MSKPIVIDHDVSVSEVGASFAFLFGLALGVVAGLVLLFLAFTRPDTAPVSPPSDPTSAAIPVGLLIVVGLGLAMSHAGRAASERGGCLNGLAGMALSLAGGFVTGAVIVIFFGALLLAFLDVAGGAGGSLK